MTDLQAEHSSLSFPEGPLKDALFALKKLYVFTPAHEQAQEALRRLLTAADASEGHKGLLLIGPSGVGKSTALKKAREWLASELGILDDGQQCFPLIELSSDGRAKAMVSAALQGLGDPMHSRGTQGELERRLRMLAPGTLRAIAFDEFHHTYMGKTQRDIASMQQTTKNVVTMLKMPVVLSGLNGCEDFIDGYPELRNRFRRRIYISDVKTTNVDSIRELRLLLREMDKVLPCEPDVILDSSRMISSLLVSAQFSFGNVVDVVHRACEIGAMTRSPRIASTHYAQAHRESAKNNKQGDNDNPFLMAPEIVKMLSLKGPAV